MRPFVLAFALAGLAACAPVVQRPQIPAPSFAGPRLEGDRFVSFDGAALGFSHWDPPGGAEPWAVIVGLHGMDDYANAFHLAGPYWAQRGIATYAYDQRGFGRSPDRGVWGGDRLMTEDLRTFVGLVRARFPHATIAVVGESLGGAVAIEAFASDRPPAADRLILAAPAVWGWSSQPIAYQLALQAAAHLAPAKVFTPPGFVTEHILASDNIPELEAMGRDPLMIWGARSDALYGLVNTMQHGWEAIDRIRAPTLYLLGAHDQIIPEKPSKQAAARLPAGDRTAFYAEGWHLLLRDKQAHNVYDDVAAFIRDPAAPLPSGAPPIAGVSSRAGAASSLVSRAGKE
jgi:alpha-beta hydrolase superfamily lysophospholipase